MTKDKNIMIRIDEKEKAALFAIAATQKISASALVRQMIADAIAKENEDKS